MVQRRLLAAFCVMLLPVIGLIRRRYRRRKAELAADTQSSGNTKSDALQENGAFEPNRRSRRRVRIAWFTAWVVMLILACDSVYLSGLASKKEWVLNTVLAGSDSSDTSGLKAADLDFNDLRLVEKVHYATLRNHGFPPRPRCFQTSNALTRTYYRGNDERHETMFNGGKYRTVTFHLHLETEDGRAIQYGQPLDGEQQLYLNIEFVRAPHTANGYFTREWISHMYLTMKADRFLGRFEPVADRLEWTETKPETIWAARFPIPAGDFYPSD